jgi:hypothetical protein
MFLQEPHGVTSQKTPFFAANVVPSSLILFTLIMEAKHSSKRSVLTRATRRNITEDDILHSHRRENLKSDIALSVSCEVRTGFFPQKTTFFSHRREYL